MERDTNTIMMNATHELAKKNGCFEKVEAILDYYLPEEYNVINLTDYQFDLVANVGLGCNEGIYLNCYIKGVFDNTNKYKTLKCGTYKTLRNDLETAQIMGELAGSLTYFNRIYVNKNFKKYTPDKELAVETVNEETNDFSMTM